MKRTNKHGYYIDSSLVNNLYHVCLCGSEKQFIAELDMLNVPVLDRPNFIPSGKGACVHYLENTGDASLVAIVCIDKNNGRPGIQVAGLLVHESVHIFDRICDAMGEREPSSEFKAYSIQWIAQQLMWRYQDLVSGRRNTV